MTSRNPEQTQPHSLLFNDPTPDVPEGVVNPDRQREMARWWAARNEHYSDERGYVSGAIELLLAESTRYRTALEKIAAHDHGDAGFDGNCAILLMTEAQEALDG